ncbi:hypothetical protein BGY98DRAFT_999957, partial [Russula aff. rugulosa BPL654]
ISKSPSNARHPRLVTPRVFHPRRRKAQAPKYIAPYLAIRRWHTVATPLADRS